MSNVEKLPKPPKKFYGFLPENRVLLHLAFFTAVVARIATSYDTAFPGKMTAIFIVTIYLVLAIIHRGNWKFLYTMSRRLRYYNKNVSPFLKRRYGISVQFKGVAPLFAFSEGEGKIAGHDKDFLLLGMNILDDIALGKHEAKLEPNDIMLAAEQDTTGSFKELERINDMDHTPKEFHPHEDIPLEEFEGHVNHAIYGYLAEMKQGRTLFNILTPDNSDEGLVASMEVVMDDEGNILYSQSDLKKLSDSLVFGVRMYTESLLMVIHQQQENATPTIAGVVFHENRYRELDTQELRELVKGGMGQSNENFRYVESIKEL